MQIAAKESRIFIETAPYLNFAANVTTFQAGFYQQILSDVLGRAILWNGQIDAERLVDIGAIAHRQRQTEIVEVISHLLIDLPFGKTYKHIGQYFNGLCLYRRGSFNDARKVFESLLPVVRGKLRARTIMALAGVMHDSKEDSSLPYYIEAGTIAAQNLCDPYTIVQVVRMTAIHKSLDGDHKGAVNDLERLFPISKAISATYPFLFLEYLNSLTCEYLEMARLKEATRILRFVLASPLSKFYPECHETYAELKDREQRASRSVAAVGKVEWDNVFRLNVVSSRRGISANQAGVKSNVKAIEDWKFEMAKKANTANQSSPIENIGMEREEIQNELIDIILDRDKTNQELLRLLDFAKAQRTVETHD